MNKYTQTKKSKGFTLIELMVAMVIGLIVLLGLVSLFTNVSILNRAQTGLALLQENGRYAISRMKQDIENAGQKHCASVALPTAFITDWDQGYEMKPWYIDSGLTLSDSASTNGLPEFDDVQLDLISDVDQLTDEAVPSGSTVYPLDPSFFIRGHECTDDSCQPALATIGGDLQTNFRTAGIVNDTRVPSTDILTLRYLTGGTAVSSIATNTINTLDPLPGDASGNALIADCKLSYITSATWGSTSATVTGGALPNFALSSKTSIYSMDQDFQTVSYFLGVDDDPNNSGNRVIPSLYRSQNGVAQAIVEGVERFDVFYLAQLQTGKVARLTANQVQQMTGGGDLNSDGAIDSDQGCTVPPTIPDFAQHHMPNNAGCLWRSIYAIEVYMLLNTVNDSSSDGNEVFRYSVDGDEVLEPADGLVSGLSAGRMYRKEFSATVPIRNYTL